MKKVLLPLICLTVILTSCGNEEKTVDEKTEEAKEQSSVSNSTLEEVGASIIISLKENDSTILSELVPTKEDVIQIVSVYTGSEADKKSILAGADANTQKITANTNKAFSEIRKKGNKAGVKWDEIIFINSEYDIKKENNIEIADLKISFNDKDGVYKIRIAECIKTERGWLIFDKPQWRGRV